MSRFVSAALVSFLLIGMVANPSLATGEGSPQNTAALRIADIQAKLFFGNTGRFSSNIFEKKIVLWNVIIGEGGVEGPSEDTLVIVKLNGPPKGFVEGLKLRVVARTARRVLTQREVDVGPFNGSGSWYTPLMLNGTGCEPVEITATLKNVPGAAPAVVSLPFQCGE